MTEENKGGESTVETDFDSAFDEAFAEAGGDPTGNPFEDAPVGSDSAPDEPEAAPEGDAPSEEEKPSEGPTEASEEESPEGGNEEEESLSLSPEELEAIKSDPKTLKLYKSLMRGATQKYQEISAQKKFLDALQTNPRAVIEEYAKSQGLSIVDPTSGQPKGEQSQQEAAEQAVDDVMEDLTALFGGEGAQALKPVLERMMKGVLQKEIAPIRETNQQVQKQQAAERAKQTADTFRATHTVTPEIELKMMEIAQTVMPAPGATPDQFLEYLYQTATAGQAPKVAAKEVVKRVKAAASGREPSRSTAPAPTKKSAVVGGMDFDAAFDAAFAEAKEEIGTGKLFDDD